MSGEQEGWGVRARPAVIALALFVALLLALVVGAGTLYRHWYAAQTRAHPERFPTPVLETIDTAPDDRRVLQPPRPPAGIDRARAAVAARGDALWGRQ